MELKDIHQAYFLGIGGIGMSAIARYFNSLGIDVKGYDKTETSLTQTLVAEGIQIHYEDLGDQISSFGLNTKNCLVVLTPAIPKEHQEWKWLKERCFKVLKRSEILGLITDAYITIGVAGTHGKTTTSTLIAHILKQSHVDCAAFLGGIATNYGTNLLLNNSIEDPKHQYMVVEADEFDRSFLTLYPSIAIITSTDADHLDIYGEHNELKKSFKEYAGQCKPEGWLILKKGLDINAEINRPFLTYSVKEEADVQAINIHIKDHQYYFDLLYKGKLITGLTLGIPGLHNIENATAAIAACLIAGVTELELKQSLASFKGVKRRFEYIIKQANLVYIDDYAHHPEELKAIISSVKNMYPSKKIAAVFQPHLFSRTRDFAAGFSESLSLLDNLILMDIYPARELPIEGITSKVILDKMTSTNKQICERSQVIPELLRMNADVYLTLGAGDIDQLIQPLKMELLNKKVS